MPYDPRWNTWQPGQPIPTGDPPTIADTGTDQGMDAYLRYTGSGATVEGGQVTQEGQDRGSFALGGDRPAYTPYSSAPPDPRQAYGPYLAGDIANRTIGIDEKTRVDPYSGTRYTAGNDNTWRESGSLPRAQLEELRAAGALPPVAQQLAQQSMQAPGFVANPQLRGGAATAGLGGTLGPTEVPQLASFARFNVPGLGFNAADYRPGPTNIDLNTVKLPTTVANRPYGQDFGGVPAGTGGRSTGPAAIGIDMPRYQVPETYQGGPSGFSANGPYGGYFQPMALPFNITAPTFGPLSQSAPATIPYTGGPGGGAAGAGTPYGTPQNPAPPGGFATAYNAGRDLLFNQPGDRPNPALAVGPGNPPGGGGAGSTAPGQVTGEAAQAFTAPARSSLAPNQQAMVNALYPTALEFSQRTGIPPEVYLAMNASESNWGNANSLFGVKGTGDAGSNNYATQEVQNGQRVNTNDQFARYSSPAAAYQGFTDFLNNNSRYGPALAQYQQDRNPQTLLDNINKAGYATDPGWSRMIGGLAESIRPNLPTGGPTAAPGGGTNPVSALGNYAAGIGDYMRRVAQAGAAGQPIPPPTTTGSAYGTGGDRYVPGVMGPGELRDAGMTGRGGGAALMLNGTQTADIRNGGTGFGFNFDTILKDSGRGANVPNDPAAKAMAAMALMNAQNNLMQAGNMKTPLDAYLMMKEPSMSNYGAPMAGSTTPGQNAQQAQQATASAIGQAEADRKREEDAMFAGEGPSRGFAQGGTVQMLPPPRMEHYAGGGAVQASPFRARAPIKTSDEGGLPLNVQTPGLTAQGLQDPNQVKQFAAGGTVVAPIKTTEEQGGIVPTGQQQQQQPLSQPLAPPSVSQASASGTEANLSPIQSGETSSIQPSYGQDSMGAPTGIQGGGTNQISPVQGGPQYQLNQAQPGEGDVYKPFNDALSYLSAMNRQRQNQSVWSLGKLNAPTGVATLLPGQTPQGLPPGMYYDPTTLINQRIGDIKSLQDSLAALGNPGSIGEITQAMQPWTTAKGMWDDVAAARTKIAGYGQLDPVQSYFQQLAPVSQALEKYGNARNYQSQLAALGPVGDPAGISSQIAQKKQEMQPYQAVQDLILRRQALGDVSGDPVAMEANAAMIEAGYGGGGPGTPGYQNPDPAQAAAIRQQIKNIEQAQQLTAQINNLDPSGQAVAVLGQKTSELDALQRTYEDAQKSMGTQLYYQNLLNNLGLAPGEDINAGYATNQAEQQRLQQKITDVGNVSQLQNTINTITGALGANTEPLVNTMLTGLQDQMTRARKVGDTQTQLSNLIAAGVPGAGKTPGFARGGIVNDYNEDQPKGRYPFSGLFSGGGNVVSGYAKGGNWIAGATSNSHGQFAAKAKAAGKTTRQYASEKAGASGKLGKQARLAKTLMGFAGGGSMVTQEPIIGFGVRTGQPRFMVGEPQRPGGPPMKERLTITPMNQPTSPQAALAPGFLTGSAPPRTTANTRIMPPGGGRAA